MAANVSLLSDMSDKLSDYCRTYFKLDDRQLSSEEMGEFYYAFNKANAFSSATPRESSRPSHRDFVKLLNAYEKYAHAPTSTASAASPTRPCSRRWSRSTTRCATWPAKSPKI